jgi:hypothetical protein
LRAWFHLALVSPVVGGKDLEIFLPRRVKLSEGTGK